MLSLLFTCALRQREKPKRHKKSPINCVFFYILGLILADDKTIQSYNVDEKKFIVVILNKLKKDDGNSGTVAGKQSTPATATTTSSSSSTTPVKSASSAGKPNQASTADINTAADE